MDSEVQGHSLPWPGYDGLWVPPDCTRHPSMLWGVNGSRGSSTECFLLKASPGIDVPGPLGKGSHIASASLFGEWWIFVIMSFIAHSASKAASNVCIGSCNPREEPEPLRGTQVPSCCISSEEQPGECSQLLLSPCPVTKTYELPQSVSSLKFLFPHTSWKIHWLV